MPNITINEKSYEQTVVNEMITDAVYIPGYTSIPDSEFKHFNEPILVQSIDEFVKIFGDKPAQFENNDGSVAFDKSYIMAYYLLLYGLPVYYEVVDTRDIVIPTGAADPDYIIKMYLALKDTGNNDSGSDSEVSEYEEYGNEDKYNRWENLSDRSLFPYLGFITTGGYPSVKLNSDVSSEKPIVETELAAEIINVASQRKDCIAIVDHDINLVKPTEIKRAYSNVPKSDYAAAFTPWINVTTKWSSMSSTNGSITPMSEPLVSEYEVMPAGFGYLLAYANSIKSNQRWLAVAGSERGQIPLLIEPITQVGERKINTILEPKTGFSINPIANIVPFGNIIWGNRTLKMNDNGLTATSFLNIRMLLNVLKKTLYHVSRRYTFEQNSDILWINFRASISPILESMVTGQGIKAYRILKVESDKRATLSAVIRIVPIEPVEDFEITIEIVDDIEINEEEI